MKQISTPIYRRARQAKSIAEIFAEDRKAAKKWQSVKTQLDKLPVCPECGIKFQPYSPDVNLCKPCQASRQFNEHLLSLHALQSHCIRCDNPVRKDELIILPRTNNAMCFDCALTSGIPQYKNKVLFLLRNSTREIRAKYLPKPGKPSKRELRQLVRDRVWNQS